MTQGLRRRGTRRSTIVAMIALICAVAIAPVLAAPPASKEVDLGPHGDDSGRRILDGKS